MPWTQTTLLLKDAAGTNQPVIAYTDGTNFSLAHPLLDPTGAIISPATSGKQDAGNASLGGLSTSIGARDDTAATTDVGTFSLIALIKRGLQALASIAGYLAPVPGVIPVALDTTAVAGRSFVAKITSPNGGNVSVNFSDGTTGIYPVSAGLNVFPFAVTRVNGSGTTATGTYENWK